MFSAERMSDTLVRYYFKAIGLVIESPGGLQCALLIFIHAFYTIRLLDKHRIASTLYKLVEKTDREDMIKAIITSLSYNRYAIIVLKLGVKSQGRT